MLRAQVLIYAPVQLLVGASGFRGVYITAARNVAVWRVEIDCAVYAVEVRQW